MRPVFDRLIFIFVLYLCREFYAWIATSVPCSHACVLNMPADI